MFIYLILEFKNPFWFRRNKFLRVVRLIRVHVCELTVTIHEVFVMMVACGIGVTCNKDKYFTTYTNTNSHPTEKDASTLH